MKDNGENEPVIHRIKAINSNSGVTRKKYFLLKVNVTVEGVNITNQKLECLYQPQNTHLPITPHQHASARAWRNHTKTSSWPWIWCTDSTYCRNEDEIRVLDHTSYHTNEEKKMRNGKTIHALLLNNKIWRKLITWKEKLVVKIGKKPAMQKTMTF